MQRQQESTGFMRQGIDYRSISELIRGVIFVLFALFIMFAKRMNLGDIQLPPLVLTILVVVLVAYGLFRIYRGIKLMFFKRD
jgi:hypothetical protein